MSYGSLGHQGHADCLTISLSEIGSGYSIPTYVVRALGVTLTITLKEFMAIGSLNMSFCRLIRLGVEITMFVHTMTILQLVNIQNEKRRTICFCL